MGAQERVIAYVSWKLKKVLFERKKGTKGEGWRDVEKEMQV